MAKLSAHGTEVARFELESGEQGRRTISIRSDRTILAKVDLMIDGRRYGGTWKLRNRNIDIDHAMTVMAESKYRRVR